MSSSSPSYFPEYALATLGVAIQVLSGWWDVISHRILFTRADPWWNPAHITLYSGGALILLAIFMASKKSEGFETILRMRTPALLGLSIITYSFTTEMIAAIWNETIHGLRLQEPRIAPAHALLILGMIGANYGVIIGLSAELEGLRQGMITFTTLQWRFLLVTLAVAFCSIWLLTAGSVVYVGGAFRSDLLGAILLSFIGPVILIPAFAVVRKPGFVTFVALLSTLAYYAFTVLLFGESVFFPWAVLTAVLLEVIFWTINTRRRVLAQIILGAACGLTTYGLQYPFSDWVFNLTLPTTISTQTFVLILAGVTGAILGHQLVSSSGNLFKVTVSQID